jgi:hypothetical protein
MPFWLKNKHFLKESSNISWSDFCLNLRFERRTARGSRNLGFHERISIHEAVQGLWAIYCLHRHRYFRVGCARHKPAVEYFDKPYVSPYHFPLISPGTKIAALPPAVQLTVEQRPEAQKLMTC